MAGPNTGIPAVPNFPSNANKKKEVVETERPEIKQLVSGGVVAKKKSSIGVRFRETFVGDDARSVGGYIFFDVIVPAAKSMISDAVSQGIERLLFGTSRPNAARRSGSSNHTSYSKMYSGTNFEERPRTLSPRARSTHDFDSIIIENRAEAEEVLDTLRSLVDQYDMATVADLYSMVGITGSYQDEKWGWTNLIDSRIERVSKGYLLSLPAPSYFDIRT